MDPDELAMRKAELLNKHQMELQALEQLRDKEQKEVERGAQRDWEVRKARAELDLKQRQYKVSVTCITKVRITFMTHIKWWSEPPKINQTR